MQNCSVFGSSPHHHMTYHLGNMCKDKLFDMVQHKQVSALTQVCEE